MPLINFFGILILFALLHPADVENHYPNSNLKSSENFCYYITKPSDKTYGINMKIFYPCDWDIKDGERNGVAKIFSDSTGSQGLSLYVKKVSNNYKLILNQQIKEFKNMGSVISARQTKIENLWATEIILENSMERPLGKVEMKAICYSFLYKQYLIGITFSCQGFDRHLVNKQFINQQNLYKLLTSRLILLDKVE